MDERGAERGTVDVDADGLAREVVELRRAIDAQATTIEAQALTVLELQRRLDGIDKRGEATERPALDDRDKSSVPVPSASTSRRHLMSKGVAAAASAAVAGTVLNVATAAPAAAAPGNFDGDPAVLGTANPAAGIGVNGVTASGTGVLGQAIGAVDGVGVIGQTLSTGNGSGVLGQALGATGNAIGVVGLVLSASGTGVSGQAQSATGATKAVWGLNLSTAGTGVMGEADAITGATVGVLGTSKSSAGVGVQGIASGGAGNTVGVSGTAVSIDGRGVLGAGGHTGVTAGSGRTQLQLTGAPAAPLSITSFFRTAGEVVFDTNKDLWLCVASGIPGTWRRVSGPSTAGAFVPLPAPVRVYDSRVGFNPNIGPKTKLAPATPRTVDCTLNSSGVPVGASGVLVNLVSTGTSSFGDMAIYKDGIPYPGTSNLNFFGFTIAVTTFSAVSTAAKVAVRANVACDVVLDVLGYYQ